VSVDGAADQAKETCHAPAKSPSFSGDAPLPFTVKPKSRHLTVSVYLDNGVLLGQAHARIASLCPFPSDVKVVPVGDGAGPVEGPGGQQTVVVLSADQPLPPPKPAPKDLSEELRRAEEGLKGSEMRREGAEGRLAAAMETIGELKQLVLVLEGKVAALQKEREGLAGQMSRQEGKAQRDSEGLEQTIKVKDGMIADLQDELERAAKDRSSDRLRGNEEVDNWKRKMKEAEKRMLEMEQRLQDSLKGMREREGALGDEMEGLRRKLDEYESRFLESSKIIREREGQVERLRGELDALSQQGSLVEQLKAQLKRQDELIASLERRVEEQDGWQLQMVKLQEQVRMLEATKTRLEEELTIARAAVEEARKVQNECDMRRIECERLQSELREMARRLQDAESRLAQTGKDLTTAKEYEAEVLRLHTQVEQLQRQWHTNRTEDRAEFEREIQKQQQRVQNLLHQLDAKDARIASPLCSRCNYGLVCPQCQGSTLHREVVTKREEVSRTSAPPAPLGVVGIKIENLPPHRVLKVTELMDPFGTIINEKVKVNDELQTIDGQQVHELPVGDVVKSVAGPAGTTVTLQFSRPKSKDMYAVTCLRHHPISSMASNAASLYVQPGRDYSDYATSMTDVSVSTSHNESVSQY